VSKRLLLILFLVSGLLATSVVSAHPSEAATSTAALQQKLKEKGFWITGADPGGDVELPDADFRGLSAIVIGDEHRGLRRLTKEHCDRLVKIPSTGRVASYNMATASGLFLFTAYLQQRQISSASSTK